MQDDPSGDDRPDECVVYRLRPDVNAFRYLVPSGDGTLGCGPLVLDGTPERGSWRPLTVSALPEELPEPDIARICQGGLAFSPGALDSLREVLAPAGEILPLYLEDRVWGLLNVTEVLDCLDPEGTEWHTMGSTRIHVRSYAFRADRLPRTSSLFKTTEERRTRIYAVEGLQPPARSFKARVEELGLRGLVFEEVWRGEAPAPREDGPACSTEDFPV